MFAFGADAGVVWAVRTQAHAKKLAIDNSTANATENGLRVMWSSLDLPGMEFLSVVAVIGVAGHVPLSITHKRDASQIILHEKRLRSQWKVLLVHIFGEVCP